MSKTIPATHDIRAVDFDDVKTFFEEIEKDTNLLHADELKFARNFLGKFGATIPPFKEEEDDDDDDEEEEEEDEECLRTKPPRAWTTRRERNGTNPNTPQKLYNAWKTRRNRKRLILV